MCEGADTRGAGAGGWLGGGGGGRGWGVRGGGSHMLGLGDSPNTLLFYIYI